MFKNTLFKIITISIVSISMQFIPTNNKKHIEPPQGYIIVTNGEKYSWEKDGYISFLSLKSKQDAIDWAWEYYEYEKEKEREKTIPWVPVDSLNN